MHFLFLTLGPTHSGKTTFGKRFRAAVSENAQLIHIDNDGVDEFIKQNYNNLRTDKAILATRTPTSPDLRLLIPQLITSYALKEGYSVIATASHPRRAVRETYYKIAEENNAKIVLLRFKIDEAQAIERIHASGHSTGILDANSHGGGTFEKLFRLQQELLEEPDEAEKERLYKVLEVRQDTVENVLTQVVELASLS